MTPLKKNARILASNFYHQRFMITQTFPTLSLHQKMDNIYSRLKKNVAAP